MFMPAQPSPAKPAIIEIEQIGVVLVDQIARPVVEILYIGDIRKRVEPVLYAVDAMRIQTLPPLFLACCGREVAVVRSTGHRAGFVGALRRLKPPPVSSLTHSYPQAQVLFARSGCPNPTTSR
jgi:hypothetical protein